MGGDVGFVFCWHNFCRRHATIKSTPAVKAGVASGGWTLAQLLTVDAAA